MEGKDHKVLLSFMKANSQYAPKALKMPIPFDLVRPEICHKETEMETKSCVQGQTYQHRLYQPNLDGNHRTAFQWGISGISYGIAHILDCSVAIKMSSSAFPGGLVAKGLAGSLLVAQVQSLARDLLPAMGKAKKKYVLQKVIHAGNMLIQNKGRQ